MSSVRPLPCTRHSVDREAAPQNERPRPPLNTGDMPRSSASPFQSRWPNVPQRTVALVLVLPPRYASTHPATFRHTRRVSSRVPPQDASTDSEHDGRTQGTPRARDPPLQDALLPGAEDTRDGPHLWRSLSGSRVPFSRRRVDHRRDTRCRPLVPTARRRNTRFANF